MADSDRRDKRHAERIPMLGTLDGKVLVVQPVAIRGLSRGGAEVETSFALQLNSLHEFRLTLGEHSVVVKARVVHCRIADLEQDAVTYRTGIEFVDPQDRVASTIAAFIDTVKDARRGA